MSERRNSEHYNDPTAAEAIKKTDMKLQRCPFCGSEKIRFSTGIIKDDAGREVHVVPGVFDCLDCGARVAWHTSSRQEAAKKWNSRNILIEGLYYCDPSKNTRCKKGSCHINGGPCYMTASAEFADKAKTFGDRKK